MRYKYVGKSYSSHDLHYSLSSFGTKNIQLSGFIENAYYNGFGRYVCQLQRLTLKFCKFGGASKGVRDFIENKIVDYSKSNPGVVVYLKPRRHKSPVLVCEYLNGSYHWMNIHNFCQKEIEAWIDYYTTRSGEPIKRFRKPIRTFWPSVQGPWNPFLNKPTCLNLITFPDPSRGGFIDRKLSATEQLLKMKQDGELNKILFEEQS